MLTMNEQKTEKVENKKQEEIDEDEELFLQTMKRNEDARKCGHWFVCWLF